jgi:gliding motility-associated-like protein
LVCFGSPAFAQLNAEFSASTTQTCTGLNVQFKDNTTGSPISWFWDFGNGQTSFEENPLFVYTTPGKFTVRLTVKNSSESDYEEKTSFITVNPTPQADFQVTGLDSGCVSLSTSFKDISQLLGASISSWAWDFGDGSTSSTRNPTHIYSVQGAFDVSLTLTTDQGCTSTKTLTRAVVAGNKPNADFTVNSAKGCASILRAFKDKTTGPVSAYFWDYGDGSSEPGYNPQHHYLDTGYFSAKLIVSNNGCLDTVRKDSVVYVEGPAAKFKKSYDCADPFTFTYKDISVAETGRLWEFDGLSATSKVFTHTFPSPGIYYVKLSVSGIGCKDSIYDTLRIKTGNPGINITPQKNIYCRNDTLLFTIKDYDELWAKTYSWNLGDGAIKDFARRFDTLNYVYRNNGNFKPELYIKNRDNCIDTVRFDSVINIRGPFADFTAVATGCTNDSMTFRDMSVQSGGRKVVDWFWSFGDGGVDYGIGPVKYAYIFPGTYNGHLTITDEDGCSDSITHKIEISETPTVDAGLDTFTCAGTGITLNASGADSYLWQNNPALNCTNCTNPIASPSQSETYYVTGTTNGCSATDSVHINVQQKELVTIDPAEYEICSGGNSVMLEAFGVDNYSWSPSATLSSTIVSNPVAHPSTTTTYTVTGSDSRNCFTDVASVTVTVNAKPSVSIADSVVQVITGFNYTIPGSVGSDVLNFEWLPPTGLSCTDCLQPTITVTGDTEYKLVGTNQFGCYDTASINIIAACSGSAVFIPNTFSPNNDGMNDYFYPRSAGNITIRSLTIFNRWGQMVFQNKDFTANDATAGWNGKFRNKLQQADVYVYFVELQCAGKQVFLKKGNLSLIR